MPLRPLGVADILDGAIGYVRRDPRTVLGISAVLSLVLVVLSFLANFASFRSLSNLAQGDLYSADPADEALGGSAGIGGDVTALVAALLSLPISVIATGLLTVVVGQAVLGRRVSAGAAWRAARPQFWRLVGLTLLIGLIVGGTAVLGIGLAVLLAVLVAQVSTGLAVLLGILLGVLALCAAIWLAVRLLLSPVALILEKAGVGTAIRRSARLVSGSWWRVFGIALLAQLIAGLIAQVLTVPFAIGGVVLAIGFPSNGASGGSRWRRSASAPSSAASSRCRSAPVSPRCSTSTSGSGARPSTSSWPERRTCAEPCCRSPPPRHDAVRRAAAAAAGPARPGTRRAHPRAGGRAGARGAGGSCVPPADDPILLRAVPVADRARRGARRPDRRCQPGRLRSVCSAWPWWSLPSSSWCAGG